jgi:hypothetical protein
MGTSMFGRCLQYLLVTLAMLAPLSGARSQPPAPQPPVIDDLEVIYDFYLGGIPVGKLTVSAAFGANDYRASSVLQTTGIVGFFYNLAFEAEVVGTIDADGLFPMRYSSDLSDPKHQEYVEISFADGTPLSSQTEPARRIRPWSIKPGDQRGTTDPLSAALTVFIPGPADAVCEQRVDVYDGRHRFALDVGTRQRDGASIRCDAIDIRLAGYKPKKMGKHASRPFTVFFEERNDGLFHVVRIAGETRYGMAVLLLRE